MEIIAHGIDLVDCPRIERMVDEHGQRFLDRVFTEAEQEYAGKNKNKIETLAGRFAAKEAILKLIGTGWRGKIAWTDIEVVNDFLGVPRVNLKGEVAKLIADKKIGKISVSISHTGNFAMASAVAVTEG